MDLPPGKRTVGCKWVCQIKYKVGGNIERHKPWLVVKGFTQTKGIDFFETFSPVSKLKTMHLLLALGSVKGWYLEQFDVNNVFFHSCMKKYTWSFL